MPGDLIDKTNSLERLLLREVHKVRKFGLLSSGEIDELYEVFKRNKSVTKIILNTLRTTRIKMEQFESVIKDLLQSYPSWEYDRKCNILYIKEIVDPGTMESVETFCTKWKVQLQLPLL